MNLLLHLRLELLNFFAVDVRQARADEHSQRPHRQNQYKKQEPTMHGGTLYMKEARLMVGGIDAAMLRDWLIEEGIASFRRLQDSIEANHGNHGTDPDLNGTRRARPVRP